jgi:hypothetical protein
MRPGCTLPARRRTRYGIAPGKASAQRSTTRGARPSAGSGSPARAPRAPWPPGCSSLLFEIGAGMLQDGALCPLERTKVEGRVREMRPVERLEVAIEGAFVLLQSRQDVLSLLRIERPREENRRRRRRRTPCPGVREDTSPAHFVAVSGPLRCRYDARKRRPHWVTLIHAEGHQPTGGSRRQIFSAQNFCQLPVELLKLRLHVRDDLAERVSFSAFVGGKGGVIFRLGWGKK